MDCCNDSSPENLASKECQDFQCPFCQNKGSSLKRITLESLLKTKARDKIRASLNYKFCKNPTCSIVYFSKDKNHYFIQEQLSLKVTIKDQSLDVPVCYCFKFSRQDVLDELKETGKCTVKEKIKASMHNPGCFCERSNPQGACCLANVEGAIKELRSTRL